MEGQPNRPLRRPQSFLIWLLPVSLLLSGCGGGTAGGGSEPGTPASSTPSIPPPGSTLVPAYATIRLTWDAHSEPGIAGYYVFHGTASGAHPDKVWAGKVTRYDYPVSSRGDHYFAITAIDQYGNESRKSEEIHIAVP